MRSLDDQRSFCAVEADELALIVIQVAAQVDAEIRIVVESLDKIWKFATVFEVEEAAGGLRAARHSVGAGNEMNSGNQVNEEVSGEP